MENDRGRRLLSFSEWFQGTEPLLRTQGDTQIHVELSRERPKIDH